MKKIMYLLSIGLLTVLVGCGPAGPKMADFTQAYKDAGATVETEKQAYSMVGAKDGVMFYMDTNPVKIYEFASTEELDKAQKDFAFIKDWPINGLFALETNESNESKAEEIFNSVK